ncbi:magnesium/cobalt transporter CorA [Amphiplicatus metriothermophilus]|uniref:Magnesium transport protein CorA n=1 Tax=Amphiplicatus metriothermophilus TaxID=1519374 RepID=A0A239PJ51_9PROT|nr:magnesium/cobalt transporter CorA [Amphiplicatus metriothermophilus]MBB5517860.1 magnesium transporter [Amphiplicatus metriothermophilus]SNT67806.1 magnesium transporter [Amphiplicatus metriothermophilus]
MITGYAVADGKIRVLGDVISEKDAAVWIDMLRPSPEEEKALEAALTVDMPTREEMSEIEISSRLYAENGAVYMTALILSRTDGDDPTIAPATFVLAGSRLITIRYEEPRVFELFAARAQKAQIGCVSAETILVGLLEAIIDRLADVLERAAQDTERLSREIFQLGAEAKTKSRDFRRLVVELGRKGDLGSKIRDSVVTLNRLFGFLALHISQSAGDKELKARLKTLSRDAASLADHLSYLSQKITFLLDATLGMINIEQNQIIKIFSVAAVCFLPPTLIASVYGMNFEFMPELSSPYGYPIVIAAMILSAVLPLFYFKRRGWL